MAGGGQFISLHGPGGRASRFLDAVVAFVVAIFQPIFRVFAATDNSHPNPSLHPSPPPQQTDENNHAATKTTSPSRSPSQNDLQTDPDNIDATSMHPQRQGRLGQPRGPREINANANSQPTAAVRVTLPQIGPPNGPVKQENVPANGVASVTNASLDLADATNGAKFRALGEEQAEENRQEQLTLPPPIQSVDDQGGDDQEDPAIAAERAVHHGFMNQALDMVRLILRLSTLFSICLSTFGRVPPSCCSVSKTHISSH